MKTGLVFAILFASALGVAAPLLLHQPAAPHQAKKPPVPKAESQTAAVVSAKEEPEIEVTKFEPSVIINAELKPFTAPAKAPIDEPLLPKRAKLSGDEIYAKALNSTVWIINPSSRGSGSGVLINAKEKYVVTNYHVVFHSNVPQHRTIILDQHGILARFDARNDPKIPSIVYAVELVRGVHYVLEMESQAFSPMLAVHDSSTKLLAFDKAEGGKANASVNFIPSNNGTYNVVAATASGKVGAFTIRISRISDRNPTGSVAPVLYVYFPTSEKGQVISDKNHYLKPNQANQEKHKAMVVAWNEAKDLAVVKLNYLPAGVEAMALAMESSQPGQLVHSIGNPGKSGALWVYSSGTVRTAPYQKKWHSIGAAGTMSHDAWVIETQSPTNPGDSGGPLINDNVELVGITQGFESNSNSISLFVDVREVRSLLRARGYAWFERK